MSIHDASRHGGEWLNIGPNLFIKGSQTATGDAVTSTSPGLDELADVSIGFDPLPRRTTRPILPTDLSLRR